MSEFATLVKLAERYGLLVLHWSRSNIETFVVQDESTTFRYRAAAEPTVAAEDALSASASRPHDGLVQAAAVQGPVRPDEA